VTGNAICEEGHVYQVRGRCGVCIVWSGRLDTESLLGFSFREPSDGTGDELCASEATDEEGAKEESAERAGHVESRM
jgi:hypothetical protein